RARPARWRDHGWQHRDGRGGRGRPEHHSLLTPSAWRGDPYPDRARGVATLVPTGRVASLLRHKTVRPVGVWVATRRARWGCGWQHGAPGGGVGGNTARPVGVWVATRRARSGAAPGRGVVVLARGAWDG